MFLKKFPKAVLTNCVVHHRHLTEVILTPLAKSYKFKPEMDEIPAKMAKPKEGLESTIVLCSHM